MLCSYCQVEVRGSGCQSQSQANQCANNRGRETGDWDDYVTNIQTVSFTPCIPKQSFDTELLIGFPG